MSMISRPATILATVLVVAACGGGSTSSPGAAATAAGTPSPSMSVVVTPTPPTVSLAPSAAPSPSAFVSKAYGYTVMVPAGWSVVASSKKWDGISAPPFAAAEGDKFEIPGAASAAGMAAPTTKDLAGYVQDRVAANNRDHADTCPPVPDTSDPIEIGGEPATLLSWDCGILINLGITVHDGVGYMFGMRDPDVHAATDPTDRALFVEFLKTVQFPG
jgi:hypothetical protein